MKIYICEVEYDVCYEPGHTEIICICSTMEKALEIIEKSFLKAKEEVLSGKSLSGDNVYWRILFRTLDEENNSEDTYEEIHRISFEYNKNLMIDGELIKREGLKKIIYA